MDLISILLSLLLGQPTTDAAPAASDTSAVQQFSGGIPTTPPRKTGGN